MRVISAEQVAQALSWPALIDSIGEAFRDGVEAPPRHHHSMNREDGEATMLLMPAWQARGYIGVKMVNVFPQNSAHGLPAISGVYLLSEGAHGRPLACMDGSELTRRRTAAASALACRELARKEASSLLMVGTGKLAPMLIEAHAAVRPITRVRIWGRNPDKARALAEHYADRFDTQVVTDLATASSQADIISCATLSSIPLIKGAWLKTGSHLDLVGAFKPNMREADATCLRRGEVFVDTHAGAKGEAGDILQAVDEGAFDFSDIRADMSQLLRGERAGRSSDEAITVFKSVGASLEDLAAAIQVWQSLGGDS
ncbi:ornithine cyclodeaminase family protein [Marinobacter panjinensis]|uniref:Ornithine cyclodeaminase family protein n=1 Tax=Marinobacter panjinensis TaxID=2576384 RepID=A0A4U6R4Y5_9GAMM|nr:ornithine cyclodeaminase family protein [Marinobacter panjinensis]MCR8914257.1 ornithine cyclodeaminase family protein [Marinobacter panjinensis]TKV68894.1 ornithine cyclodeaminase family protein [Marinobacter panjinensis]